MSNKTLPGSPGVAPVSALASAWAALRVRSLGASFGPLVLALGCAFSSGDLRPWAVIPVLAGGILVQVAANLANDYFDHRQGADRLLARGRSFDRPAFFVVGAVVAMAVALALAADLVVHTGLGLLAFALAAALFGFEYTAPPLRLNYRSLGEFSIFVLMGPGLVEGAFYALTGAMSATPALAALAPGLLIAAVLLANNLRDRVADEVAGKRTLAVRLGTPTTTSLLAALFVLPNLVLVALALLGGLPHWTLIALVALPWSVVLARSVRQGTCAPEKAMGGAYALALVIAVLSAVGFLLA